jgi:hypothetical protein
LEEATMNHRGSKPRPLEERFWPKNIDMDAKGRRASGDRSGPRLHPERMARGDRNGARLHPETRQGERNGRAKLTADQVVEIRRLYKAGGITQQRLAARFGVSDSMICFIVKNQHWKSVKPAS